MKYYWKLKAKSQNTNNDLVPVYLYKLREEKWTKCSFSLGCRWPHTGFHDGVAIKGQVHSRVIFTQERFSQHVYILVGLKRAHKKSVLYGTLQESSLQERGPPSTMLPYVFTTLALVGRVALGWVGEDWREPIKGQVIFRRLGEYRSNKKGHVVLLNPL